MGASGFSAMIQIFARAGRIEHAEQLLEKMEAANMVASSGTYNHLIAALAKNSDVDGAERWLARLSALSRAPFVDIINMF